MSNDFVIANFKHVADGLQPGQFAVGDRKSAASLDDLDPIYRELLDEPVTVTMAVIGPDGRPGLTPMWFDHENDKILVNTASHRPKCGWIAQESADHHPGRQSEKPLPLGQHQVLGGERAARGWPGRRPGDRAAQPHLAQVHRGRRRLRVARPRDRREARAVRVPDRPHRDVREAVGHDASPPLQAAPRKYALVIGQGVNRCRNKE